MYFSFCNHPKSSKMITTKFCTWPNSLTVMSCANIYCDLILRNQIREKIFFIVFWLRVTGLESATYMMNCFETKVDVHLHFKLFLVRWACCWNSLYRKTRIFQTLEINTVSVEELVTKSWAISGMTLALFPCSILLLSPPDSKVHGANMGPTWVLSAPDRPNIMNLVIRAH